MKKYYLNKDVLVIRDEYSSAVFAYNRRTKQKYSLNQDAFTLLKVINKKRAFSDKQLKQCLGTNYIDILEQWQKEGILSTVQQYNKYIIKEPKTSFVRLFLEVTSCCNLRCKHCYGSFGVSTKQTYLDTQRVVKLIKQAAKLGFYQLDLTGGEALLHPGLEEILKTAYEYGMMVTIFSNLTLLTPKYLEIFVRYRVKKIVTSVESIKPSVHDEFRGGIGALDKTLRNLELVRNQGIENCINIVIGRHNVDTAVETVKYFHGKQYDTVVDFIANLGRTTEDMILSLKESKKIYKEIVEAIKLDKKTGLFCGVGTRMVFVSSEGNFGLCPLLASGQFTQGNLNTKYKLSKIIKNIFKTYSDINCSKECKLRDFCNGGCRARAFIEKGSLYSPYELYCYLHGVKS